MPEEANICLECLTLCEERKIKSTSSKSSNTKTNLLYSCLLYIFIIFSIYFAVLGLSTKRGEIKPANTDFTTYYENDETTDSSINNNKENESNHKIENYQNNSDPSVNTQPIDSQNNSNSTYQGKSSKSLNTNSSVIKNIKINPTTKPSNTSNSSNNSTTKKEITTSKLNQQTTKPSVSNGSTNNTTKPTVIEPEYDKFEHYLDSDGKLHISKYTGNSKNVIVPDKINNINVYRIEADTFKDNSSIETITFKDSVSYHTLWIQTYAINNCTALKKIIFPKNTDLGILYQFARNCPKLNSIDIDNWQYEFVNGGLYYWNTNAWYLYYYCEGFSSTEFRPASFFRGGLYADLFKYCKNVKKIYLNDANYPLGFYCIKDSPNQYLESIYIDKSNTKYFDVDGVVFEYATNANPITHLSYYSPNKKDNAFKIPENVRFDDIYNNYLEDLTIPKTVTFYSEKEVKNLCMKQKTKNLKTIRIQKGSPYTEIIKSTFTGTVIEY